MFRVIKINDQTFGHPTCASPSLNTTLNINLTVFSEDTLICVGGDQFSPHPNPICVDHITTINPLTCSTTVFAAGIPVAMENLTTLMCGDVLTLNPINITKTKVFIGS